MRLFSVLSLAVFLAGGQPTALAQAGPPPPHSFGDDTYRTSQQCTGSVSGECTGQGTTQPGLSCEATADGGRKCTGFLASAVDGTLLDVTLTVPAGTGPHPHSFGDDTYGTSQQCAGSVSGESTGQGTTQQGLSCEATADGGRKCTGFHR